jgi:hypothetical protein
MLLQKNNQKQDEWNRRTQPHRKDSIYNIATVVQQSRDGVDQVGGYIRAQQTKASL